MFVERPRSADDPVGIYSLLDTDLYKLTMQCAVLHSGWGDIPVTYTFTNRTPSAKITRKGYEWLVEEVGRLCNLRLSEDEGRFLRDVCKYLPASYVRYLEEFRFIPWEHVELRWKRIEGQDGKDEALGDLKMKVAGTWADTILYEIPLLVLISECYFRFTDTDWNYDGQVEKAYGKGMELLRNECMFSEFGTRRRRSYKTQELVLEGLIKAWKEFSESPPPDGSNETHHHQLKGKLVGTSNVHFAHRYNLTPIGTVAHEWFMGIAAITGDYKTANLTGLTKWVDCFGPGVLSIALTDTFGTEQFLKCFKSVHPGTGKMFAEIFTGVRQDSGDPEGFVEMMREFCKSAGLEKQRKMIVFSDSLNVDLCLRYKSVTDKAGLRASFGVGTFLTNDFTSATPPHHTSTPMNIVIKLSSANGNPAVKISDNIGKNTGDKETVDRVKQELGYTEKRWVEEDGEGKDLGDERFRWGRGMGMENAT